MSKPTNIVTPSRKSQKKCKDSKNLCGKAICWNYVLVGLSSSHCPALWVYCKTEPSLEEEAPSVRARKLQRISGGFFCQEHQPTNQPNHPNIHLIHHSTHSFQDVANLLPRYLIQDLNHSWSFMGSQATCFFMEMECAMVIIYISHLVGNSEVDNSEVSTIKSSHLLMRWLSVCCSKLLPYGATSKRLKPGKW